jgi:nucleoside-diphosphate-sugar epimerase
MLRDLEPKRDFICVRDCVRALWTMAGSGTAGAVYNGASGESTAIAETVRIFLDLARVRPIEVRTLPSDEVRSSVREQWVSNTRMRALGWKPEETVRQAIGTQLDAERYRS